MVYGVGVPPSCWRSHQTRIRVGVGHYHANNLTQKAHPPDGRCGPALGRAVRLARLRWPRSPGTHGRASLGPDRLRPPAMRGRCRDRLPPPARPSRPPVWGCVEPDRHQPATQSLEATETPKQHGGLQCTIVAVNGGGNTPQGYPLDRRFIKSWSTSGDADDRPTEDYSSSFVFTDYKPTESRQYRRRIRPRRHVPKQPADRRRLHHR